MLNSLLTAQHIGSYPASREHSIGLVAVLALLAGAAGTSIALEGNAAMFLMLAVVACVLTFMDFRVGVVLLICMMPMSHSTMFPRQLLGVTGLNPMNVLLLGTLAAYYLRDRTGEPFKGFMPKPLLWLYIVPFLIAGAMGARHVGDMARELFAVGTVDFTNTFGYVRDVIVKPLFMVLFALLVAVGVARSRDPEKFMIPTVISVCAMSLLVMLFVYLSGYSLAELSSSTARTFFIPLGIHANDLGRLYAVAYGLLLFTFVQTDKVELKVPLLMAIGALVVVLVMTFSRGAFVGFMVVNMLFLISRRNVFAFLIFAVLLGIALISMPGAVYERISAGFDGDLNALTAGRTGEIWEPLLPEMFKSPIWGSGLMSITWSDAMVSGAMLPVGHAHNAYLQAFLDMGILGTGLLLAYFAHVWRGFRKLSRDTRLSPGRRGLFAGAAAGLVSLLVAGVAGGSLTPSPEQAFLWLAIGMMYGEMARARRADATPSGPAEARR